MALSTRARLEGELNVTPGDLSLSSDALDARIAVWEELAAERADVTTAQQYAHVKALCLRAWKAALLRKADKFRAEGDVTRESDTKLRVEALDADLARAEVAAGLSAAVVDASGYLPGPGLDEWGVL